MLGSRQKGSTQIHWFGKILWRTPSKRHPKSVKDLGKSFSQSNPEPVSPIFSRIKWKAIYSMMYQIHQLVWRWSPVMRIIHTKLKSQFPQKENHLKTWQKMSFNKTLQLTQIIMIRRNIWALRGHQITTRDRHLIMDHSATCYRIMDRKETCIMEIREIPQAYINLIQWNRQPFLKVRFKFSCGIRFNGIFRYKPR